MARRMMKEGSNSGRATLYPGKSMSTQVQQSAWVTVSWVNALRERERETHTKKDSWGEARHLDIFHVNSRDVVFSGGITDSCVSAACVSSFHLPRIAGSSRDLWTEREEQLKESKVEETSIRCNFFSSLSSGQLLLFPRLRIYLINGDLVFR